MTAGRFNPDDYVPVHERVLKFREENPKGRIETEILSSDDKKIVMRALVWRDTGEELPAATGHAEGFRVEDAILEKTESSAVGRALALLGYEAKRGIASKEEMEKFNSAQQRTASAPKPVPAQSKPVASPAPQRAPEEPKAEVCSVCGTDLTKPPIAQWLKAKRATQPDFPPICPTDWNKQKAAKPTTTTAN